MFTDRKKEPLQLDASKIKPHLNKRQLPAHVRAKLPKRPAKKEISIAMKLFKPILLAGFSSTLLGAAALAQPAPSPSYVSSPAALASHRYDAYPHGVWAGQPGTDLNPLFFRGQIGACPGGADGISRVASSREAGAPAGCFIASFVDGAVDVRYFGAVGDGVTNDRAAFVTAISYGCNTGNYMLKVPSGTYRLLDSITLCALQTLQGDGRGATIFDIPNTFNLAAAGVIIGTNGNVGSAVKDIQIRFQQPDSAVRADMVQYPPALQFTGVTRGIIDGVRIQTAWDGIVAENNPGGMEIGYVEISALNDGIRLDGALDFVKGGQWHFWCWGMCDGNIGTVYRDGNVVSLRAAHVENLTIAALQTFHGKVILDTPTSAPSVTPVQISVLSLDSDQAQLLVGDVNAQIAEMYSTKSSAATIPSISVTGASRLSIGNYYQNVDGSASDVLVNGTGAEVIFLGGSSFTAAEDQSAFEVLNGVLAIHNMRFRPADNVVRTKAWINQSGASATLVMTGNVTRGRGGTADGPFLTVGTDLSSNFIVGNNFETWLVTLPATIALGEYGPNKMPIFTATPTVGFATAGDFNPAYASRTTRYWFPGNGRVGFVTDVIFNTNAYTTASGNFYVAPAVPTVNSPDPQTPVTLGVLATFGFDAGAIITPELAAANRVNFRESNSGGAVTNLTTADVPASTNGFQVRISGEYRYR